MKELFVNLKFTWNFVKYQKKSLIKFIITQIIGIIISVIVPIMSAKAIIYLTDNMLNQLVLVGIALFFIENARNLIHYFSGKYSQIIYRETLIRLQYELGNNMLKLDNNTIDKNSSGVFIQRLTNDTSRLADVFASVTGLFSEIIADIGIFLAIFIINKIAFAFVAIELIILFIIEKARAKRKNENDKVYRKESEKVSGFISEMVRGIRDVKMLNAEKSFLKTMKDRIYSQNQARYIMSNTNRTFQLFRGFVIDFSDLIFIILMVFMIKNKLLNVANALVIRNYSSRLPSLIYFTGEFMSLIKDFNLSASRVKDIMESDEFKKETFGTEHIKHINGDFEFKKVKFKYPGSEDYVLNNLNFKVNANETVAFVGKSGAGKSTIFSLLCKMYDIEDGTITIDGIDIKELDKDSIRGNITIISQNPYIFNLSIKDNLRLVKDNLTMKEIRYACKMACLDDFIESLPNKYDTIIGEGGVNLSGGQRQRLAIARALVQKTEIILFDEATSALDNETQNKIQEAITNMKGEYTILIIAHRLSTIINSDRILLIDKGKVRASGTHKELLETNAAYKKLYESELKLRKN